MARRTRVNLVALTAVGALLFSPLIATTSASAAIPGTNVLFISNSNFSDVGEEDAEVLAAIATFPATVTVFDGGDASAAAWSTALAGIDMVIIPEAENGNLYQPGGTLVMDDAAAAVLLAWATAGGDIVGLGAYSHQPLVSYLTGLDYSGSWVDGTPIEGAWLRQAGANAGAPGSIPAADYSGGLEGYGTWPAPLLAGVTPWYLNAAGDNLGVGSFAVGAGSFVYVAYDWYPDPDDIDSGARAVWDTLLKSFFIAPDVVVVVPPATGPALAATGADLGLLPIGGSFLLLGLLLVVVKSRRKVRSA